MIATKRLAYHFAVSLPCVACGKTYGRELLNVSTGLPIDAEAVTMTELMEASDVVDTWCEECSPLFRTTRTKLRLRSDSRKDRKRELMNMALLKSLAQIPAKYDKYKVGSLYLTKREFLDDVRHGACTQCDHIVDRLVFINVHGAYHADDWWASKTLDQIITTLEGRYPVCNHCSLVGIAADKPQWHFNDWYTHLSEAFHTKFAQK